MTKSHSNYNIMYLWFKKSKVDKKKGAQNFQNSHRQQLLKCWWIPSGSYFFFIWGFFLEVKLCALFVYIVLCEFITYVRVKKQNPEVGKVNEREAWPDELHISRQMDPVLVSFWSTWHKLETFGKTEHQLKTCLQRVVYENAYFLDESLI